MGEHPNVESARAGLEAFMKGDRETLAATMAEDVIWHVPGSNPFAGEFRGKAEVLGRFQRMAEAGINLAFDDIHDVVGNEDHVVALVTLSVTAGGGSATTNSVQVYHVKDGKMTEFWGMNENQADIDALMNG